MSLDAHLAELTAKHRMLEKKLEEAMRHPSSDDLEINRLKLEKLRVKDELTKLNGATRH